jgi:hypothetical protein
MQLTHPPKRVGVLNSKENDTARGGDQYLEIKSYELRVSSFEF